MTTQTATRQIAKVYEFPSALVPVIDWSVIGSRRAELACDMDVRRIDGGPNADGLVVTLFWSYAE